MRLWTRCAGASLSQGLGGGGRAVSVQGTRDTGEQGSAGSQDEGICRLHLCLHVSSDNGGTGGGGTCRPVSGDICAQS